MPVNPFSSVTRDQQTCAMGIGQGCSAPVGYLAELACFSGAPASAAEWIGRFAIGGTLSVATNVAISMAVCGLFAASNRCMTADETEDDAHVQSDVDTADRPQALTMTAVS